MKSDVIIAWSHGGIPKSVEPAFKRPTKFINIPSPSSWKETLSGFGSPPVRGILAKYAPGIEPVRVAALGFSASCQGVAQLLGSADGGRLDAAVVIDGLHVGYVDKAKHTIGDASMKPWFEFAKLAVVNERLMVVTHSSVVPPGYASTTETADWLWKRITNDEVGAVPPLPEILIEPTTVHVSGGPATGQTRDIAYPVPPIKRAVRRGGLVVIGMKNLDGPGTADHIYQAKKVMPWVLESLLAPRWNAIDPEDPGQSCYVA